MIQIGRHIEILLLSNDCVIVPGLGGFVTHKVDARYDKNDCIFLPPIRTLGFNPQLQLNDSLLVISYVEAFDISYPEALRMIEAEVEELKQILVTDGSYEMNGIGTLYLNKEGTVVFEPCEAGVLTPDLYALSSFDFTMLPVISKPALTPEPEIHNETAAESNNIKEKEEIPADTIVPDNDSNDNDSEYIQINATWLKAAMAAAAVLLLAIVLITPNETVNGYCSHMTTWSTELLQKLIPKDTNIETVRIQPQKVPVNVVKKAKREITLKNQGKATLGGQEKPVLSGQEKMALNGQKTLAEDKKEDKAEEDKKIESCYTIVLASSITETNAKAYVHSLKAKGYNDAIIYNSGHMIRVVYGNFDSMQNAQDSLRKLRDNKDFEEAWVLKI